MTLGDVRRLPNALNAVRLALALTVLVIHSWTLGGFSGIPTPAGVVPSAFAVLCFFALSGYLIADSRLKAPIGRFVVHRCLRLLPGLFVVVTVVAFVIAPLSTLIAGDYAPKQALRWWLWNVVPLDRVYDISGTLPGVPYPGGSAGVWNGSLWTLCYELICYAVIGLALIRRRWSSVALVVVISVGLAISHPEAPRIGSAVTFCAVFSGAALLRFVDDRLRVTWPRVLLSCGLGFTVCALGFAAFAGPFLLFGLAGASLLVPAFLQGWRTDLSYGVYIWAFPVQQLASLAGVNRLGHLAYLAMTASASVLVALASWTFVERPAVRWKRAARTTVVALPRTDSDTSSVRSTSV